MTCTFGCSLPSTILYVMLSDFDCRSGQVGDRPRSGRISLASHTLSYNSEGILTVVPLDPSKISQQTSPTSSTAQSPTSSQPPGGSASVTSGISAGAEVEEQIVSQSAQVAHATPTTDDMNASFSASAPGASASFSGGSVNGAADASVSATSPQISVTPPEVEMRKKKGFSLPGFGKKHKSATVGAHVSGEAGASGSHKSRDSKTKSMPGFNKKAQGTITVHEL